MTTYQKIMTGLAATAVVCLIAVAITSTKGGAGDPPPPPSRIKNLKTGDSISRSDIESKGFTVRKPSAPVNNTRLAQTYRPGKTYNMRTKISVYTQASHKDWGFVQAWNMQYVGEFEIDKQIESNDGTTLVSVVTVNKAATLTAWTQIDGLRIDLGSRAQGLLNLAGQQFGLTPGWVELSQATANQVLDSDLAKQFLSELASDETAKCFLRVDALQGKSARVTYKNGVGVTDIRAVGTPLTEDDILFFACLNMDAGPQIFPAVDSKPGDTWTVRGEDFLPIVDPSLHASITGEVKISRKDRNEQAVTLQVDSGALKLQDRSGGNEVLGQWTPKGSLNYSLTEGIVSSAQLNGRVVYESQSTHHILFEMKFFAQPEYSATYACTIR